MFRTLLALLVLSAGEIWSQPLATAGAPTFDVAAATDAYLAQVSPEKKAR